MIKFSNLLALAGVLFRCSQSVTAEGCFHCCPGSFFVVVNGNDNQVPLPTRGDAQLCSGVPVNIWFELDSSGLYTDDAFADSISSVGLTLFGDEELPERCEHVAPYALFGDHPKANFAFRAFDAGRYAVQVHCNCGAATSNSYQHSVYFDVIDCPDPANA